MLTTKTISDNVQTMKRKIDQLVVQVDVGAFYVDVQVGEFYIDVHVGEFMLQVDVGEFFTTLKELELMSKDTPYAKTVESLSSDMQKLASEGEKEKPLLLKIQGELIAILDWLKSYDH